jgi:hypothetical protein
MAATSKTKNKDTQQGPSGFLELDGQLLVVDYGKIYANEALIGQLHEDGLLENTQGPLGVHPGLRPLEDVKGCVFRGISANGINLEIPGPHKGPSGQLLFNGQPLFVVNGRLALANHELCGRMDDDGNIQVRDPRDHTKLRKLDENTCMNWKFKGIRSSGQPWQSEFIRPLSRPDKTYCENEILRYFEGYDRLTMIQKRYVTESMNFWAKTGFLQIVRKSEGTAALGNVKHGAAGVTGVRTGNVTLDKEEFEKEIGLVKQCGALAVFQTQYHPFVEIRLNLVVAHEYGHQLEFVLSQSTQDQITELYQKRKKATKDLGLLPKDYDGNSEIIMPERMKSRQFASGYSAASMHEYWAEAAAAFSVKESRDDLAVIDAPIHQLLTQLISKPEAYLRSVFSDTILDLQASLAIGGEFNSEIFKQDLSR